MSELFERLKVGDSLVTTLKHNVLSQFAMCRASADPNASTDATTRADADRVENIIIGLNLMVFPNVACAAGASIGLDMARVAEGHAHLIFIEADCNLAAADEAFFGGGVAVELCPTGSYTLASRRAAADQDDGKRAEQMRYFHNE